MLIELLVVVAVMAALISLLVPAVQSVRDAALAAQRFDELRSVASRVLETVQPEDTNCAQSPCATAVYAIDRLQSIVSSVLDEDVPPNPADVEEVLNALDRTDNELTQELLDLRNPANNHVPGALEAYIDLKHKLQTAITHFRAVKGHVRQLRQILAH